jgi:hypothetical protein
MVEVYCDPEVMRFIPGGAALSDLGTIRVAAEARGRGSRGRGQVLHCRILPLTNYEMC